MIKPLIGITVDSNPDPENLRTGGKLELNFNYAQVVTDMGGVPLLIPPMADMEALSEVIHGWLIPGGDDIDAERFGEENHPKVSLQHPSRYNGESRLWQSIASELPVLGICYGCQFLNVVSGGSLYQHLPDVVGHEGHTGGTSQVYAVDPGSQLEAIIETNEISGKSYHHQAIHHLGHDLKVVARSEDDTVEAIESTNRPWVVGVQWHPERTQDDTATRRIFEKFIEAARTYAQQKA